MAGQDLMATGFSICNKVGGGNRKLGGARLGRAKRYLHVGKQKMPMWVTPSARDFFSGGGGWGAL